MSLWTKPPLTELEIMGRLGLEPWQVIQERALVFDKTVLRVTAPAAPAQAYRSGGLRCSGRTWRMLVGALLTASRGVQVWIRAHDDKYTRMLVAQTRVWAVNLSVAPELIDTAYGKPSRPRAPYTWPDDDGPKPRSDLRARNRVWAELVNHTEVRLTRERRARTRETDFFLTARLPCRCEIGGEVRLSDVVAQREHNLGGYMREALAPVIEDLRRDVCAHLRRGPEHNQNWVLPLLMQPQIWTYQPTWSGT